MRIITCPKCLHNRCVYHMDWDFVVCSKCKSPIANPDQLAKAQEVTGLPAGRLTKLANICTPTKDPNRKWGQL